MSALAERIDRQMNQMPPSLAARLERLIEGLLDVVAPEDQADLMKQDEQLRRQNALEALNRIAARGGIAGIEDPVAWQREQRVDRPLPGREP